MGIRRIGIVSIPVKDQQASRHFYTEVLGFTVMRDSPMGPDQRWIELAPAPGETTITLVTWYDKMAPGSVQGVLLEVDGIDEVVAGLQAKGLTCTAIDDTPWGRFSSFSDPDGNGWTLQENAPEMPEV